jgi:hypothetical protein
MGCLLGINKRFWTSCARCEIHDGSERRADYMSSFIAVGHVLHIFICLEHV